MEDLLKNSWTEEDHSDFYSKLRDLSEDDQSKFVLLQAARLSKIADHKDLDMLKAAESLVNFWIIKYSNSAEKGQADYLLENIQSGLRELE
tara:strand:+ start:258 stop:530 length:273 start_codon:yes stop_codon:yes gene_type:complete